MNGLTDTDPEIVAQVSTLKAAYSYKLSLIHQINKLKFRNNYQKSNKDFKDLKDLAPICKIMWKRFDSIRRTLSSIQKIPKTHSNPSKLSDSLSILSQVESNLEVPRQLFSLNFNNETALEDLKSALDDLSSEYEAKCKIFNESESAISNHVALSTALPQLEAEVEELSQIRAFFFEKYSKSQQMRNNSKINRKKSFEKIKLFQKLSENGVILRSKLLLKQELLSNLKIAGNEYESLSGKIKEDEEAINVLEIETKETAKETSRMQEELVDWKKEICRLQMRLQGLYGEKDTLLEWIYDRKDSKDSKDSKDEYVEDETVQISSWVSGFDEMLKEKESLVNENKKLKDRIGRLMNSRSFNENR